jgi:hypothetical protein
MGIFAHFVHILCTLCKSSILAGFAALNGQNGAFLCKKCAHVKSSIKKKKQVSKIKALYGNRQTSRGGGLSKKT